MINSLTHYEKKPFPRKIRCKNNRKSFECAKYIDMYKMHSIKQNSWRERENPQKKKKSIEVKEESKNEF